MLDDFITNLQTELTYQDWLEEQALACCETLRQQLHSQDFAKNLLLSTTNGENADAIAKIISISQPAVTEADLLT